MQQPDGLAAFGARKRRLADDISKRARRRPDPGPVRGVDENAKRSANALAAGAALPPPPGGHFSAPMTKRTRLEGGGAAAGAGAAAANPEMDAPRYSQRQAQAWEARKDAEIAHMRAEFQAYAQQKEADVQSMTAEHCALQERAAGMQAELARAQEENAVLKRGVSILQQRSEQQRPDVAALQATLQQAVEHIRRLEQTNYALQVQLAQAVDCPPGGGMMPGEQPPDVF